MIERDTTAGVLEENGLFLVGEREKGSGPLSEKWEFIGGKRRYGETLEETLEREWMEEVGFSIRVGEFLMTTEFVNQDTHYTLHAFKVFLIDDNRNATLSVHKSLRWVDKNELSSLDFGPSDSVIRDYLITAD